MGKQASDDQAQRAAVEIGRRLRSQRATHGWTLDDLAVRSGVSRRMIVNIEQGTTNASIGTLLRLGSAFGVSLSELVQGLDHGRADRDIHRAAEQTVLWHGEHGGQAVMVTSANVPDMVELWDWTLGPGDRHDSEAHAPGTRELVHVLEGRVRVSINGATDENAATGETVDLAVGDALTFPGDVPHEYSNPGRAKARFSLTVYEPLRRPR